MKRRPFALGTPAACARAMTNEGKRLLGRWRSLAEPVLFGGITAAAAGLASRASGGQERSRWYRRLRKAPFQPPPGIFAPVWTGLYTLMSISAYRVWRRPAGAARRNALALWGAQLGINMAWTWLFFGRRNPVAAMLDNLALAAAVAAYMREARRVDPAAANLMVPYIGWVSFAAVLNEEIVRRNRLLAFG